MAAARPALRPARIRALPPDLEPLVRESLAEGHDLLRRLQDDWCSGANRFDREGEALFEVRDAGRLVGVGGLNRDPYAAPPEPGRLRRLYVARSVRRAGVGRTLVEAALAHATGHFAVVRLKTYDPGADRFYRALGFARVEGDPDATHRLSAPFALAPPGRGL